MKQLKFAIVMDGVYNGRFSRDYLISWFPNITYDSPEGLTYTSYEHFIDANYRILHNTGRDIGVCTLFNTRQDAEQYACDRHTPNCRWDDKSKCGWKVIQILIDLDDEWKNIQSKI